MTPDNKELRQLSQRRDNRDSVLRFLFILTENFEFRTSRHSAIMNSLLNPEFFNKSVLAVGLWRSNANEIIISRVGK